MDGADEHLLHLLLEQLGHFARAGGFSVEEAIDVEQCRTILEVTGGDIDQAAQLYWDDYLVRRNYDQNDNNNPAAAAPPARAEGRPRQHPGVIAVAPQDMREQDDSNSVGDDDRRSRVRRRLERDFNGQVEAEEANEGGDVRIRLLEAAQETVRRSEQIAIEQARRDGVDADNGINANVGRLAARAAELLANHGHHGNESVSISDDESGAVWKVVGGIAASWKNNDDEERRPPRKRRKTEEYTEETSIDKDGYLSDNDWVWDSVDSRKQVPLCDPFDLLWGLPPSSTSQATNSAPRPAQPEPERQAEVEGNVIADDDGDGEEGANAERSGIPRAWLNTGFSLSEDGMGLVLPSPSDDDVAFFGWQQQANGSVRDTPPPPFHCGSISALLSIVTGLLYTGVSYQKLSVSASSARVPFGELSKADKKREFESRLADVLAVLLLIAAKSSLARKEKALTALKKSKDPADIRKWQKLERKLRLCPTCWWETDSNGESRLPLGRESDKIQIATSYTNIEELRSYVLSNMRSFTTRGGCALFLETVTRIHGKGVILRLIEKARREGGLCSSSRSLIHCKCEDSNKDLRIPPQQLRQRAKTKELMEALPKSASCASVELISLLLTGRVYSTLKGWSTGVLGLGLLSYNTAEIGKGLSRPRKPVWILQGPSTYSVIWMSSGYDKNEQFAKADQPDSVIEMTHFCCWPGQRNTSVLRLTASHYQKQKNVSSASSCLSDLESIDPHLCVKEDELTGVHANEEDCNFYKDNYRMWRFRFDESTDPTSWIPFYRLSKRQKLVVETKLGPKINTILWKRWPRAIIEGSDSEAPHPVV